MSTYFFKTDVDNMTAAAKMKDCMDKLEARQDIDHWKVHVHSPEHLLEVVTDKMSPQQVKHYIREGGFDVDFTKAPQV